MKRLSGSRLTIVLCVIPVLLGPVGCGGMGDAEDDANAPAAITFSETYLTVRNQSASAITEGLIELVPAGVLPPFRARIPRIETGASRDIPYAQFGGSSGARFQRGAMRIRTVRVTVKDIAGTAHTRELEFR